MLFEAWGVQGNVVIERWRYGVTSNTQEVGSKSKTTISTSSIGISHSIFITPCLPTLKPPSDHIITSWWDLRFANRLSSRTNFHTGLVLSTNWRWQILFPQTNRPWWPGGPAHSSSQRLLLRPYQDPRVLRPPQERPSPHRWRQRRRWL